MKTYFLIFLVGILLAITSTCVICNLKFFKQKNTKDQKIKGKVLIIVGSWLFFPFIYGESFIGVIGLLLIVSGIISALIWNKKNSSSQKQPSQILPPIPPSQNLQPQSNTSNTISPSINQPSTPPLNYPTPINATPEPTASTNFLSTDTISELKKFKDLLDVGAITQDEFDAKKKELLDL